MTYKKYFGKTFQEARFKMLIDLGSRGYVLSHRKVKPNTWFGFMRKAHVEITAAILEENKITKDVVLKKKNVACVQSENTTSGKVEQEVQGLREEFVEVKSLLSRLISNKTLSLQAKEDEIQYEKILGSSISRQQNFVKKSSGVLNTMKKLLETHGFAEQFIEYFCSLPKIENLEYANASLEELKHCANLEIKQILKVSPGMICKKNGSNVPNVMVVVGPTGVGKTTTVAKLAAYFGIFKKKKIHLASIDTYRVGATQQLQMYADIMDLPFKRIKNIGDLDSLINDDSLDAILLDTAGRSPKSQQEIQELKHYLDQVDVSQKSVALALSATTKYTDLLDILDCFTVLQYDNIIVTKLDETNSLGAIVSAIYKKRQPLSYITFGQSVPEDIEEANESRLLRRVLHEEHGDGASR